MSRKRNPKKKPPPKRPEAAADATPTEEGKPLFKVDTEHLRTLALYQGRYEPIASFTSEIVRTCYRLGGSEDNPRTSVVYTVRVRWLDSNGHRHERNRDVESDQLSRPERWLPLIDGSLTVLGGAANDRKLQQAMRVLKDGDDLRVELDHTGWNGDTFVMPTGTVHGAGRVGIKDVQVESDDVIARVTDPWAHYSLRQATSGAEARAARAAVRDLFSDFDPVVAVPLVAYNLVTLVKPPRMVPVLLAKSQTGKTPTATILSLRFFGKRATHSGWKDTTLATVETLYQAKDVVTVMDDLVIDGPKKEEELKPKLEGVIRGVSGEAPRKRLRADGSPKSGKSPRGGVVITAEHIPKIRESLMARCFVVECPKIKDAPNPERWKDDEPDGPVGLLEVFTDGFVRWLQGQRDSLAAEMAEWADEFKDEAGDVKHARVKENAATLWSGMRLLAHYLESVGEPLPADRLSACRDVLVDLMVENDARIAAERSVTHSIPALLGEMLSSGAAHLRGPQTAIVGAVHDATIPADPAEWGWRQGRPMGPEIGVIEDTDDTGDRLLRLYPTTTWGALERFARSSSVNLQGESAEVWKHLMHEGRVKPGHKGRGHGGAGRSVPLHGPGGKRITVIETTVRMFFGEPEHAPAVEDRAP